MPATSRPDPPSSFRIPLMRLLLPTFLALLLALLLSHPPPPDWSSLTPPRSGSQRAALVLTAHPDDEAMFFSPVVQALVRDGWDVRGLCLSIGNSSGLGETRKAELVKSYAVLGVPAGNVEVTHHPLLPDDIKHRWDERDIRPIVEAYLLDHPADLLVTFDSQGITSHPNHTPLASLSISPQHAPTHTLHLVSPTILNKFTGPLFAIRLSIAHHLSRLFPFLPPSLQSLLIPHTDFEGKKQSPQRIVVVSTPWQWATGWRAMLQHKSQLVWFRWLYLLASRLMWVNELVVE